MYDRSARSRLLRILIPSLLALAGLSSLRISGQEDLAPDPDRVPIVLRARVSAGGARPKLEIDGRTFRAAPDLVCFYERRKFVPAWSDDRGLFSVADDLLGALGAAAEDGLLPEDYRVEALRNVVDSARSLPDAGARAELDLLLTDAFLVFASDLRHGKVNPESIYSDCALAADSEDLAAVLETALGERKVRAALAGLAPPQKAYRRLREALRRYRDLALVADPGSVPPGPTLRLGDSGERVVALRARLAQAATADAAAPVPPAPVPDRFDDSVAESVLRFQERHGLTEDGVVGRATVAELNRRAADHVGQIEANLERRRWLPHDLGKRHVLVNIAAFRLEAVEDARTELEMKVIVGKPFTKTPMFSSAIDAVLLNPSWYVPQEIAVEEILPKAAKDPGYLHREGYEVLSATRLRQKPGPGNALGRIKFVFPNRFGVYLHDTSAPGLFGRTVRAFSHGCIRIEKPFDLAVWAFRGNPKGTPEAIRAGIDAVKERLVPLPEKIPVHVAYWTAWVGDDGALRLGRDIYRRDAELIRRLHAGR